MFKNKYRIVYDRYAGYEVQVKKWYLPFWIQAGGTNTFCTLELAKVYLRNCKNPVVYEDLP